MAFATEPVRKVEIKPRCSASFVDVSDYVIDDSTVTQTVGRVSTGKLNFDDTILDIIPNLDSQDEIKITLGDSTPDTLFFTGILDEKQDNDEPNTITWTVKDFGKLASNRRATEVFREDAATGDPVDAFKDLVDKYLPELTYDSASIPNKPTGIEDFKDKRLQNELLKETFDFIAKYLGRIWFVDETKKIFLITRTFTDSGYTLITKETSADSNIIGNLTEAIDTKRWANYVSVDGKSFPIGFRETFNGDASTTEFTLSIQPKDLTVTVDGVVKRGGIEGSDFESDADYLVDKGGKTFDFTVAETPGVGVDNVVADLTFVDKIHDEFSDEASIGRYGKKDKLITDDSVETLDKAREIANNYLSLYSVPLKIYSGRTFWNDNVKPLNNLTLRDTERNINQKFNVMQVTITFGVTKFDMRFKLNDFDFDFPDLYEELVNRVNRIEFNERDSGQQIAKYLFFGAAIAININTVHISKVDILGDGSWGIGFGNGVDNDGTWGEATYEWNGTFTNSFTDERIINRENIFEETFHDDFFKDAATTADWDTANKIVNLTQGEILRTKITHKNNVAYSAVQMCVEGSGSLVLKVSGDGGSNFETTTTGAIHTFTNKSTAGIQCQIESPGTPPTTVTNIKLRGIE